MGIQAAIYRNDLPCEIFAFVGCKVYAHGSNIIRRAIAGNLDVIKENILQHVGYLVGVFFGDDKTWTHAIASNAVLPYCSAVYFVSMSTPAFAQA